MQQVHCKFIYGNVFGYLFPPENFIAGGPFKQMAVMTVPETAMNHDHSTVTRQNNVRLSGESLIVKPVAKSTSVKALTDEEFRSGVLATYAGHHPASDLWGYYVCHFVE
jgi:hypothetical protein